MVQMHGIWWGRLHWLWRWFGSTIQSLFHCWLLTLLSRGKHCDENCDLCPYIVVLEPSLVSFLILIVNPLLPVVYPKTGCFCVPINLCASLDKCFEVGWKTLLLEGGLLLFSYVLTVWWRRGRSPTASLVTAAQWKILLSFDSFNVNGVILSRVYGEAFPLRASCVNGTFWYLWNDSAWRVPFHLPTDRYVHSSPADIGDGGGGGKSRPF